MILSISVELTQCRVRQDLVLLTLVIAAHILEITPKGIEEAVGFQVSLNSQQTPQHTYTNNVLIFSSLKIPPGGNLKSSYIYRKISFHSL